jgi:hypothetical protein
MPHIDDYRFGRIVIDGRAYKSDLIVLPHRVVENWWREEGHVLHAADLGPVFDVRPKVLVVGQGAYGRMRVAAEAEQALTDAGIELVAVPTAQACETYNAVIEERAAAAALHLTC